MDLNSIYILLLIAFGTVVQTLTGFAMGLIIIGGVTLFGLADIGMTAALVSLISVVNASVALRKSYKFVDWSFLVWIVLGLIPSIVLGVMLLDYLSRESSDFLSRLLGFVIISAGTLLMLKPSPFEKPSGKFTRIFVGICGGLMGGMYGAGGAPIAYLLYRQPIDLNAIRAMLFAGFAISTFIRTSTISVAGQITEEVLSLAMYAIPLVIILTMLTSKVVHLVPDMIVRRFVFALLIVLGFFLIVR